MCVPWVTGLDTCPICAEDFEKFWDENADGGNGDWMIRNALDPGSGQVVHAGCWRGLMDGGGVKAGGDDDDEEGDGDGGGASGTKVAGRISAGADGGDGPTGPASSLPSSEGVTSAVESIESSRAPAASGGGSSIVMEEVVTQPHVADSTPTPPAQVGLVRRLSRATSAALVTANFGYLRWYRLAKLSAKDEDSDNGLCIK